MVWKALLKHMHKPANSRVTERRRFRPLLEELETRRLPSTFIVANTNDSGPGSLRYAINEANANPGLDTISFAVPEANTDNGYVLIDPTSPLPTITDPVDIDGTTQAGYAGTPLVALRGYQAGANANGLDITGGGSTVEGLIINGFSANGILLENGGGNTIEGDYIGTNRYGDSAVANQRGIYVLDSANNFIGGTTSAAANVISGNLAAGIRIEGPGATGNRIEGNDFGTDVSGEEALANGTFGVYLLDAPGNTVGGSTSGAGNLVSGNVGAGVRIEGSGSSGDVVAGNSIGTNVGGTATLGNGTHGIYVLNAPDNTIGGTASGAGNLVSGNLLDGIRIEGSGASGNAVQGNKIGTDVSGDEPLANETFGVYLLNASGNSVGGSTSAEGNLISGNGADGVRIEGSSSSGNIVAGNLIGTNAGGTAALDNGTRGIYVLNAPDNTIGGTASGAGNLVSGNVVSGIRIEGSGASGNIIQGNKIGTDVSGDGALANGTFGVYLLNAPGNTVGGSTSGAGNLISGNVDAGVRIEGNGSSGEVVAGNLIGTNAGGTAALSNGTRGIYVLDAPNNTIGGTASGAGNLISGNLWAGIRVEGNGATGNSVEGNLIGTDNSGTSAIGNGTYGVIIADAPDNTVGGTASGAGNTIAFNGADGVTVTGSSALGNAILGNSIFVNRSLGIELSTAGATPADFSNGVGPNQFQNYPVLTSATSSGLTTTILGTLTGPADTTYRVEFFANPGADPSGFGQGKTLLGFADVETNSAGVGTIDVTLNLTAAGAVSATATGPSNNTSEFSADVTVQPS